MWTSLSSRLVRMFDLMVFLLEAPRDVLMSADVDAAYVGSDVAGQLSI